jgi:hypothetical protein
MKGPALCLMVPARVLDDGGLDPVWYIPSRNTGRGVYGYGKLKDNQSGGEGKPTSTQLVIQ